MDKVKVPDVPEGDYVLSWRWEPCFTAQAVQGDGGDGHVMKYHLVMTNRASPVSHNQTMASYHGIAGAPGAPGAPGSCSDPPFLGPK